MDDVEILSDRHARRNPYLGDVQDEYPHQPVAFAGHETADPAAALDRPPAIAVDRQGYEAGIGQDTSVPQIVFADFTPHRLSPPWCPDEPGQFPFPIPTIRRIMRAGPLHFKP